MRVQKTKILLLWRNCISYMLMDDFKRDWGPHMHVWLITACDSKWTNLIACRYDRRPPPVCYRQAHRESLNPSPVLVTLSNICHLLVRSGSDDKSVGFISPSLALHQLLSLSWAWPSHLMMVMIKLTIMSEFRTIFKSEKMLCSPAEWFSMKTMKTCWAKLWPT